MKILETIEQYLFYTFVAIFPIFVLTMFSNVNIIPKETLLVGTIGVGLVLWFVKAFFTGNAKFAVGKFDLAVILIIASYLISTLLKTPNKMEAFLLPGTTTIVIAGAVLYFLLNQLDAKAKAGLAYSLLVSAVLLGISVLFTETNIFAKIPQLPAIFKDPAFSTLGGMIPAIIYIGTILPLSLGLVIKEKDLVRKVFIGVCLAVMILSLVILIKNILPGSKYASKFPDYQTSWSISVDTIKESPIWGIGPANYITAFNRFKPVSYNMTDLWLARYTTANNFYLTAITELGFAGILAFTVLLIAIYKMMVKDKTGILEKLSLVTILVFMAILPSIGLIMVLLFILLSVMSKSEEKIIPLGISSKIAVVISSLPVVLAIVLLGFYGSGILAAEISFQKSLIALSSNDAKSVYDFMQAAVNKNPNVDRYHASLAQVDMAIANNIANKKDITDAEKQTVSQLVQQAINEGKSTVILNPQRSGNWEILAQIYKSVMPYAQGADQFTIQTYSQAVALDPTNPELRIALGGVYFALGKYDDAIDTFKLAILAKPDLANSHYNLAITYKAKKDYDNAITEMNKVLSLVAKDSADYKLAQTEIEDLQKNKPAASGDNLTAPKPVGKSNITPPISLPQEAIPPLQ